MTFEPCTDFAALKAIDAEWREMLRRRKKVSWSGKKRLRQRIVERDAGRCHYCGEPANTIDHIIPVSAGGRTSYDNCVLSCQQCNQDKAAVPIEDFAAFRTVPGPALTFRLRLDRER